jgi:hypothetical protein
METTEQKELLRVLVTMLYKECDCEVEPLYPKILIRVLPKEQKRGSIWLPDGKQNKPNWEGVVLKVYKPWYQKIYLSQAHWVSDDPDPEARYVQKVECVVKPGDHIVFPHIEYGQVPVHPLDDGVGDYRMIPENIILGTLEYDSQSTRDWLLNLIDEVDEENYSSEELVKKILKNADVIRKDVVALTMSGR